jgi:hypothetical protein
VRLAERDLAGDGLRGMHDDEQRIAVDLDLRALVRALRILDREFVQAEFLLQLFQQLLGGSRRPTQTHSSGVSRTSLISSTVMSRRRRPSAE